MAHHHFTDSERSELFILLKKGYSQRSIAGVLGISQSAISREIARNSVRGTYDPKKAKVKARQRRRYSKYQGMKVRERPETEAYIIDKLERGWTPEEISGRIRTVDTHIPYISAKGIYKWLYSVHGQRYCALLPMQRKQPKRRRPKAQRSMIPNRVGIEERPQEANDRSAYGHHETDTMVSGKSTGSTAALTLLHDRKARYTLLQRIPNLKPATNARALIAMGSMVRCHSITHDNGIENRRHETVARRLSARTYFCNRYRSWEKGSVENAIGRIRRFIPKGADIGKYSMQDIAAIEHWLNHTPRKCLDFKTPYEIMSENLLFVSSDS
jgi:transposase, IS30 family